ncbi:MAG: phosphatidate cytidylyltransferase [Nitrospirae bacterium]|nr:phosphatidate cytidylyltransferase [Nitrospirota bacterium]
MIQGAYSAEQPTNRPYETPVTGRRLDGRRVYAALVFVPLFYLLVRYFPPVALFALVAGAALLALTEFYRLHFRDERVPLAMALGLGSGGLLLASLQWPEITSERTVIFLIMLAIITYGLFSSRQLRQNLVDCAVLMFGVLYVGLTLGYLLLTRALEGGEFLVFFVVLVTWAGDTGAYYVGMSVGRRQLAPVISPNKTVEGLIGGLVLAIVAAVAARAWFLPSFSLVDCLASGLLLTGAGVLGDLAESAMKRSGGVKDSGALIPGHGGMLDRLDSLLFAAPAFYYYVTLVRGTS